MAAGWLQGGFSTAYGRPGAVNKGSAAGGHGATGLQSHSARPPQTPLTPPATPLCPPSTPLRPLSSPLLPPCARQVKEGMAKVVEGVNFATRGVRLLVSDVGSAGRLFWRAVTGAANCWNCAWRRTQHSRYSCVLEAWPAARTCLRAWSCVRLVRAARVGGVGRPGPAPPHGKLLPALALAAQLQPPLPAPPALEPYRLQPAAGSKTKQCRTSRPVLTPCRAAMLLTPPRPALRPTKPLPNPLFLS